jgi:hypothetical protein
VIFFRKKLRPTPKTIAQTAKFRPIWSQYCNHELQSQRCKKHDTKLGVVNFYTTLHKIVCWVPINIGTYIVKLYNFLLSKFLSSRKYICSFVLRTGLKALSVFYNTGSHSSLMASSIMKLRKAYPWRCIKMLLSGSRINHHDPFQRIQINN